MARQAQHRYNNDLRYREGSHPRQRVLTPNYVLDPVRRDLGRIQLDPCTEPDNPVGADRFFTPPQDGLMESWDSGAVFVNPPYGKSREPWVLRCIDEGQWRGRRIVLMIPAHTDTKIFQLALSSATAVCFIRGRVKFGVLRPNRRQEAASHPSALIGWHVDLKHCQELGVVIMIDRSEA